MPSLSLERLLEHEGRLYQFPIEEYKSLREEKERSTGNISYNEYVLF